MTLDAGYDLESVLAAEKTRALLLKLRKGATAAFNVSQLAQCLAVLDGYGLQIEKYDTNPRETRSVTVIVPGGAQHTEEKRANYRRITLYDTLDFLKKHGLVEAISAKLGMPTPEQEARERKLYGARYDITNTGTCPVCFGLVKREIDDVGIAAKHGDRRKGSMVHHGYERPGSGEIEGDCFAVGYQPLEVSPQGAIDFLEQVARKRLQRAQEWHAVFAAKTEIVVEETPYNANVRHYGEACRKLVKGVDKDFEKRHASALYQIALEVSSWHKTVTRFEKIVERWAPDELPEVRHPKRQPLKLQNVIWGLE